MSATDPGLSTTTEVETPQVVSQTEPVPPAGEDIHIPGGSPIPLIVALGVTLMVIGTTIWWVWSALGFIIVVVSVGIWIRDVRRDIDALPEEHHHH
jgi:hypothetical protein